MTETGHLDRALKNGGMIRHAFARIFFDTRTGESASSVDRLLDAAAPVDPDYDALNVFIRLGFFVDDTTPFRQIRFHRLPLPDLAPLSLSEDQIIDGYIALFRQAVERNLNAIGDAPLRMGLTGGRDSRHILLQLVESGRPPDACITVDTPWNTEEAVIARRLTERCGVRHEKIAPSIGVRAEAEKNPLTNYCSRQHRWILGFKDCFKAGGHALDGIGGDVLSESGIFTTKMQDLLEQGRLDELVDTIVSKRRLFPRYLETLFPPRDDALERVSRELRRHLYAPNPLSSFYFWNRTCRDVAEAPFSVMTGNGGTTHGPYLDDDLFRFLAGLEGRQVIGRHIHTKAIHRRYPAFADIPFSAKAPPPPGRAHGYGWADLWPVLRMARSLDARGEVLYQATKSAAQRRYHRDIPWISSNIVYLAQVMAKTGRSR